MRKRPITRRQSSPKSYGSLPTRRLGKTLPVHSEIVFVKRLAMLLRLQRLGNMFQGRRHPHLITYTNVLPHQHLLLPPITLELPLQLRRVCSSITREAPHPHLQSVLIILELPRRHLLLVPITLELLPQRHHISLAIVRELPLPLHLKCPTTTIERPHPRLHLYSTMKLELHHPHLHLRRHTNPERHLLLLHLTSGPIGQEQSASHLPHPPRLLTAVLLLEEIRMLPMTTGFVNKDTIRLVQFRQCHPLLQVPVSLLLPYVRLWMV